MENKLLLVLLILLVCFFGIMRAFTEADRYADIKQRLERIENAIRRNVEENRTM